MNAITHVAQGAGCAPWCPACAQERAAAAYARLAPKCPTCKGTGVDHPAHYQCAGDCSDCGGRGYVREAPLVCPTCAAVATERTGGMAYYGETLPDCDHMGGR